MRIIGLPELEAFKKRHADARGVLDAWRAEVESIKWENTADIKARHRSADFLGNNRVIFNIKGNKYRLVVKVNYPGAIVLIEWVGTHAEYDRKIFS